jgi:8-oxo-dGTP pyrophosphatase MutT (NUDIX family)
MSSINQAVCIVIPSAFGGEVYAVSRKNSLTEFGLPGGKVDEGENIVSAIVRETQEEIGLDISDCADRLCPIYSAMVFGEKDGKNYWVTTFALNITNSETFSNSILTPEVGLIISKMPLQNLTWKNISPFYRYNIEVFGAYHKFKASQLVALM